MPRRATSTSYGGKAGNKPNTTKPGPGAPPKTFTDRMKLLAGRAKTVARLERALENEDDTVFLKAFAEVANRGYGRATETVEVTQSGGMTIKIVKE